MISREDYPNGINLTPEQQTFSEQFARAGSSQIRLGRKRRKLISLALIPLSVIKNRGQKGSGVPTELDERSFVPGNEVGIISLTDHPARYPNEWHFIESRVLVNTGFIDEGGAPCVGGLKDHCSLRSDFSKGPLMKGQEALQVDASPGDLVSPRNGRMRVARTGRYIDICVGRHSGKHNTVVFRLHESMLDGDKPACTIPFDKLEALPDPGETTELDDVQEGQVLVTFHKRGRYFKAMFEDNGEPKMQWPPGRVLPANRVEIFRVLNSMNLLQNDMTLLPPAEKPPLVDPEAWSFDAYVAFDRRTVVDKDNPDVRVDVDPTNLTTLPGFAPTQALKDDFRKAVGPHGDMHLTSENGGVVTSIEPVPGSPHITRLAVEGGAFQLLPATAVLYKVTGDQVKTIEVGDRLEEGELIGDACPRTRYDSWEVLATVLQDNLFWLLEEFMYTKAISHGVDGWDGGETLYDIRYVTSVMKFAAYNTSGDPKWYWDLRKAKKYFDSDLGAILLPPVRYDNWDQLEVVVNGVQFDFTDPFSPAPSEPSDRNILPFPAKKPEESKPVAA